MGVSYRDNVYTNYGETSKTGCTVFFVTAGYDCSCFLWLSVTGETEEQWWIISAQTMG